MHRLGKTIAAILLLLPFLAGTCAPLGEGESSERPASSIALGEPRTITVALSQAPASLDPGDHRSRSSETVIRNMFDGLVTRDASNNVYLELAEEISWLDDVTLEIKLRQGVLFHDGVEMTAEDVVFTFERIIQDDAIEYPEPHSSPRRSLIAPLQSIEQLDDYTVLMHFSGPWPPVMQMLVHQQIIPKHYLEEVGTQGFVEHPIGTGPFQFVSASSDLNVIVLERFGDYYGGAPDLPPVGSACAGRAVFRVIVDSQTRVAALLIGEVDIAQEVPLALVEQLEQNDDIQVRYAAGTRPLWMEVNVNLYPFDDIEVRQALNYAVDKHRIIASVYDGQAEILAGPLSPFNNFVNRQLRPYPYSPARAQELLARAGWRVSQSGEAFDEYGQPFAASNNLVNYAGRALYFTIDTLAEWMPVAETVADQLRDIGIRVSVRKWEREVILPQLAAGERMAYLDGWGDSAFDPVGHFEAKWHGRIEGLPYGRGNFSGYDNPRVNELIRIGEVTADPVERQAIYDEAQEIIYREAPAVFLILPEVVEAASIRVLNWQPSSDGRVNLHDVCLLP
jgi:peptide/nickel transport system substrate-binding protein